MSNKISVIIFVFVFIIYLQTAIVSGERDSQDSKRVSMGIGIWREKDGMGKVGECL